MEQHCVLLIWQRSVAKCVLRYTHMLCDGDSKPYNYIVQREIYGKDVSISKEEYINHVSKRMGIALRNHKEQCAANGELIGGKGKLTNDLISKMQKYYECAIKGNHTDTKLIKQRIFAMLFHLTSTYRIPRHVHCPPGGKS